MIYKLILNKILKYQNSCNFILAGSDKIDKYSILCDLIDLSNNSMITKNDITWLSTNIYKIFDMKNIKKKNYDSLFEILLDMINTKNYYHKNKRVIIFNNFDHISNKLQDKLRVYFEKYSITSLFICITSKYDSIIYPIRSRFLLIRIPEKNRIQKREISRKYIMDKSYEEKSKIYNKIYTLSDKKDIINYSQFNKGILYDVKSIYESIFHKIYNKNFKDIKEISYLIEKYQCKNFHREILIYILNDIRLSISKVSQVCKLISDSEFNYNKSFNKILSNETFFLSINRLLNEP